MFFISSSYVSFFFRLFLLLSEYAFLFTELFKTVNSAGGSLIFVSINKTIKLILDDIYITDILQLEDSLDKAIESLTQEN